MSYKVKKLQNTMSKPNLAYLSNAQMNNQNFDLTSNLNTSKYASVGGVLVEDMIIKLAVSNTVADDEIELTPQHMSYLGVVEGDMVKVEPIAPDYFEILPNATQIDTLLYSAKYERTENARHIDPLIKPGPALVNYLKEALKAQIFYENQKIAFSYGGRELMLVVDDIASCDLGGAGPGLGQLMSIPKGKFTVDTGFNVEKYENDRPFRPGVDAEEVSRELRKRGIGGMTAVIQNLVDIFRAQCLPWDMKRRLDYNRVKGVLFHGVPGTGKTLIARSFCELLLCVPPKVVNGPELLNKYHGQSEQNMRDLFEDAKQDYRLYGMRSPLHVFIFDEFESIAKKRSDDSENQHAERLVTQLLTLLDGVDQIPNIFVMATTNRMHMIDDAVLRPGRIGEYILVDYPNMEDRMDILQLKLKPYVKEGIVDNELDVGQLAAMTQDFSGSDLQAVVSGALGNALQDIRIRKIHKLGRGGGDNLLKITRGHIEQVIQKIRERKAN